jgi:hypothetical protein
VGLVGLPLTLALPVAADAGAVDSLNASFEVEAMSLPGDTDNDGLVTVLDLTRVERIILCLQPTVQRADANRDGAVNALDLTRIERIILGLHVEQ